MNWARRSNLGYWCFGRTLAMCRLCRWELFTSDEKAIVHVMNRTVRRCFLFGDDELTGRNYDYRKDWIELRIRAIARQSTVNC